MASTSAPSSTASERAVSARLSGVRFAYEGNAVLDGLSLELHVGTTVLLGPNGSGKSTLLSLLAGRLRPEAGIIELASGEDRSRPSVGYAAQHAELDPEMSGREHLRLFAALAGCTGPRLATDVDAAIEIFSLGSFADLWVSRMSGGMRRRLHLAISTLGSPSLWLLDEPTTGLDPQGRAALDRAMRAATERDATVFFSTHDLGFASQVASRVVLFDGGRCVSDSAVSDALAEHGSLDALYASCIGEPLEANVDGTGRRGGGGGGGGGGRGRGGGRRHA